MVDSLRAGVKKPEELSLPSSPYFELGVESQPNTLLQAEYFPILDNFSKIESLIALLPPLHSLSASVTRFQQTRSEFPDTKEEVEHLFDDNRRNASLCPRTLALVFALLATDLQVYQYHMSGEDSSQASRRRSDTYGKPYYAITNDNAYDTAT